MKTNMSSVSSLKGDEKNTNLPLGPEIVLDNPGQSGLVRVEDYVYEEEIIKKDGKKSLTDSAINEEEEILSHDEALVSIPSERDEEATPNNHTNNAVSTTPQPSGNTIMAEAYLVREDSSTIEAHLVHFQNENSRFPVGYNNNFTEDTNQVASAAGVTSTTKKNFFKTSNGKIKKKCWAFATVAVVVIVCCIIIGFVFFTSSKPSSPSLIPSTSPPETKFPILYNPPSLQPSTFNSLIPSTSPPETKSPILYNPPSLQPSTFDCSNLCLIPIEELNCPQNAMLLIPCRLSVVSNLCMDDTKCITDSSSPTCNTNHQIYRRIMCAIDEPWKRSPSGFEFYIETDVMDWESHQTRAMEFNASLASIQDQNEMNLVNSMLSDSNIDKAYIGGLRKGVSNDPFNDGASNYWKWVDNSTWEFTNWEVGEPDGGQTTNEVYESVALINNMKMIDVFPVILHPGVYKRKYTGTKKVSFSLGFFHSCALNLEDELFCWGNNYYGQIGDGTIDESYNDHKTNPTKIDLGDGKKVSKISLGYFHSCAILDDGELKCWGNNSNGNLGDGTMTNRKSPTKIDVGADQITTQVSLGSSHSCAVLHDGKMKCWGVNQSGKLGDGTTEHKTVPTEVVAVGNQVLQIALGEYHTCALLKNGTLTCWGNNYRGQLGDGTTIYKIYPNKVEFDEGRTVEKIACGSVHTCALLDDNTLWCWGYNNDGQLGDNTTIEKHLPTRIDVDNERKINDIACGRFNTCVVLDDGVIKCWGDNIYGQLGDGTNINRIYPIEINVGFGRTVTQISLGFYHTCVTLDDSSLRCWVNNNYGQLGVGTFISPKYASKAQYVAI